jgi:hypothetical protein
MNEVTKTDNKELAEKFIVRDAIRNFATKLLEMPGITLGDNENCPLTHRFTDGIYTREIFMPAGTVCVGKIHRHEHPNFLMSGKVTVVTEDGGIEEIEGPKVMISPPGTQRAVYVHTDTVWVTVHHNPDNERDLDKIESFVIAKSYDELPDVITKELI